jgi:hypothetical protein
LEKVAELQKNYLSTRERKKEKKTMMKSWLQA